MAYGRLSKLLHRLALNSDARCEFFFDLERSLFRDNIRRSNDHVFVCGLARAGTTIVMRSLYNTGRFSSLTYRDMPFPLMLNAWKRLSSRGQTRMQETERAHGDGLYVDYDSPEALEEVFWRAFVGYDYIGSNTLSAHQIDQEIIDKFEDYVALINLRREKRRYLSKNNNNILRSDVLARAFPDASIVIPFRHPVAQSASLLAQHKRFKETHRDDPFSRKYMDWLVHHEFGSNHKPFCFENGRPRTDNADTNSIQYWLELWMDAYEALLKKHRDTSNVFFLCYEDICSPQHGNQVWERLCSVLEVSPGTPDFMASNTRASDEGVESLARRARELYERMRKLSSERLGFSL